jgi:4'-phosphopantetheinyl transferase EntD
LAVEALVADSPLAGATRAFELWGRGDETALTGAEAAVVANAVDGRRTQFAAGRQCAHRAIDALASGGDGSGKAILPDDKRAPVWPEGVVGSISHTEGYALAVAAPVADAGPGEDKTSWSTVGIDAERLGRVTHELHERLFLPSERAYLASLDEAGRDEAATLMFGAKESFYKAQYPVTAAWVGFHDVELRPDPVEPLRFALYPATGLAALERFAWPLTARGLFASGTSGETSARIAVTAVVAVMTSGR